MKKLIVIHSTETPDDEVMTIDEIVEKRSEERRGDPMPYHYVIDQRGQIFKTKRDKEVCGHCGRWSGDSLSVAFVGGMYRNTMTAEQEKAMVFLLKEYRKRFGEIEVRGCNELMYPEEVMAHEPYFGVSEWWNERE